MSRPTLPSRFVVAISSCAALALPVGALAQATSVKPANAEALVICERAARQSLTTQGAPAADLKFVGPATEQSGLLTDGQIVLHGAASAGPRRFNYICNVDLRSPEAVGLVMRDTTPVDPQTRLPRDAIEPDLSHVSPAACESAVAAALKKRWPQVSEISFDSATRSLSQDSATQAELHGQGRALPAAGSSLRHFGFDCQIDPRDGRVLGVRISG